MLILSTEVVQPWRKRQFMYDPWWNQDKQCGEVVRNGWGSDHGGSSTHMLVTNLKKVKHGLLMWPKKAGRNEQKEICRKNFEMHISNHFLIGHRFERWKQILHGQSKTKKLIGVRSLESSGCKKAIKIRGFSCSDYETEMEKYHLRVRGGAHNLVYRPTAYSRYCSSVLSIFVLHD